MNTWIGVDLDGTLAEYHGWPTDGSIGLPVWPMVKLVQHLLAEGNDVRIFTARVAASGLMTPHGPDDQAYADLQRILIDDWCLDYIGRALPITATKDLAMTELYDDRAIRVETNTGRIL